MGAAAETSDRVPRRKGFLSLRWQALIAMTLILMLVNGSLALLAYRQSLYQFELQQSGVRENQARQLRALLEDNNRQMSRLVNLVPLLGPDSASPGTADDFQSRLRRALESEGALLGLDWDILTVYWIDPSGVPALVWPADAAPPGPELLARLAVADDRATQALVCQPECLQFLGAPVLWRGARAGTLVLGRSVSDALLVFHALTGADVAIYSERGLGRSLAGTDTQGAAIYPAITRRERSEPILRAVAREIASSRPGPGVAPFPVLLHFDGHWFEISRVDALAPGVNGLTINEVTAERRSIQASARNSVLLGLAGLVLSGALLFSVAQASVGRLRRIAGALPLLADNRYADLRARLAPLSRRPMPRDELDTLIETAQGLTNRMELLQRDRELAEERLMWLADHDPLTLLHNRRRFNDDFIRILDQALRYGHSGALLFLDLDQFKDVNDLSGHQVGDVLLQRVADQLVRMVRPSDLLARLGGDEFALVLPECSADGALTCAERIQAAVRSILLHEHGRTHRVTASIGIALFPDQGQETGELLANADLAMFQAKDKGRGRWHLFSPGDQAREQADARVLWRDKIAEGLREDRFELYFQPVISIASGQVQHLEALLRLHDGHGELVHPDRFIPVAEKTGQIRAIDHWVLARAVAILGAEPRLRLAVNLSASAMDDHSLLPDIERLLAKHRVEPTRLAFELTETAAVESLSRATLLMRGIQELGCRFALDDFGSGYASYAYLRKLPVNDVKIDGTFIRDLAKSREDRIVVKAITDVAHGMRKRVIAEFVESAEIYAVLRELGVDSAQGYYIGRPVPLSELVLPEGCVGEETLAPVAEEETHERVETANP